MGVAKTHTFISLRKSLQYTYIFKKITVIPIVKDEGEITQKSFGREIAEFIFANDLKGDKQVLISELFREAVENGFEVKIKSMQL